MTYIDELNKVKERKINEEVKVAALEEQDFKMAKAELDTINQLLTGVKDEQTWQMTRQQAQRLGLDLNGIPEQYDPAFVEKAKSDLVSYKDQLDLEYKKYAAQNPFGNSLDGKLAAANARGDHETAALIQDAITKNAKARGTGQMLDYEGNVIPNKVYPGQDSGFSSRLGSSSPAPALKPDLLGEELPEMPQGSGMVQTPTAAPSGAPLSPKMRVERFQTDEAIRKDAAQKQIDISGKKQEAQTKILSRMEAQLSNTKRLNEIIDNDIYPNVGMMTAGLGGALTSGIAGTPSFDMKSQIDTVVANLGFDRLQEMRDNSPTGGALGNTSEREIQFLQASARNLSNSQSPAQLKKNLIKLKQDKAESDARIKAAYERDYGASGQQRRLSDPIPRPTQASVRRYNPATGKIE